MRIYICGPCTGLPDNNYPAFHAMAAELRAAGFEVENPAENPPPACGTWAGWMRLGIAQLVRCDAILLLEGYRNSRGAIVELGIAQELGLRVFYDVGSILQKSFFDLPQAEFCK